MSATPSAAVEEGFVHSALFYSDRQEYLDGTVSFIEEGLSAGDPVAVAVPEENLQALRAALGGAAARITMLDMSVAGRNPGRIIPGVLRAFADEHPDRRVRIIGEPLWPGRSHVEYPACAEHEALINLAFAQRSATILCPYGTTGLEPHVIADARMTHPTLWDGDGQGASESYDPHRIIDGYNQPLPAPPTRAETVTVEPSTLAQARRWLTDRARRLGLDGQRLGDLELATIELVTNSIVHGGGSGTLHLWAEHEHVVCEVADTGQITDPLAGRRPAEPGQLGGRGLLLVNHLVDLVRVHTAGSGTTVRIHLRITRAST